MFAARTSFNRQYGRHIVVPTRDTQLSSGQAKFGSTSALFDGSGDSLFIQGDFIVAAASADFTIEMWVYWNSTSGAQVLCSDRTSTAIYIANNFYLEKNTSNKFFFGFNGGGDIINTATLTTSAWNHIAVVRSSNVTSFYLDGTKSGNTLSYSGQVGRGPVRIAGISNSWLNGYMDEIRISSVARYTSNFTPSATAFVNDADTRLLLHCEGPVGGTQFLDDNS